MKINFLFNAHKSYTDEFLFLLKSKINKEKNIVLYEEDLLIYDHNHMRVMIDDAATVYISSEVKDTEKIEVHLTNAINEYYTLCSIEKKFNNITPVNVFIPKNSNSMTPNFSFPYPYTVNDIDDAVSLSMHIY